MNPTSLVERCLKDPGYTPPATAVPTLVSALGDLDDESAEALERVLARLGVPAATAAFFGFAAASAEARRRRLRLVARVASSTHDEALLAPLVAALGDPAPRCQRAAAIALGKLEHPRAEAPLLAVLPTAALEEQRAIVEALGKVGGEAAKSTLTALTTSDAELARRRERALDMLQRRLTRDARGALVFDQPLPREARLVARARSGFGSVLRDELAGFGAVTQSSSEVSFSYGGTLRELLRARTALDFALRFELDVTTSNVAQRVAHALLHPDTIAALSAWTSGPPRFRLDWQGGHQRAKSWEVARLVREATSAIVNDPSGATWQARVPVNGVGALELSPRLDPDPRFEYRTRDVPAASHPTLAAALVRVAGVRDDDVVWDPFVGSGLELVERAKLGPYAALHGTDVDPRALDAARRNLDAARVEQATLELCDARAFPRRGISLIVSNPPMGRRVARDSSLRALLCEVTRHAATVLTPGGRMVWLSPLPSATADAARAAGLVVTEGPDVDLGGFTARLQTFSKRKS